MHPVCRRLWGVIAVAMAGTMGLPALPAEAAPKPATLRVLVTNDDGVGAPGIDALVLGLRKLERVRVTVVAPATNQSGQSDKTTPGPLTTTEATTASGYPAIAVQGFPADAVNFALDGGIKAKPHLVASGVNAGANPGPVVNVSGTVGAARTAVRRAVPAVAISQGSGEPPDYAAGTREAVRWVKKHRAALTKKKARAPTDVANINVPTCTTAKVRGLVEVPLATGGDITAPSDCTSKLKNPADDVIALANGYATLTKVPPG
ncbi:MAG TPA: 5'/3'-nucleotidase SurE [Acidimicrobiia bacterium]